MHDDGVWSCDTCRTILVKISKLAVQITELTSQIDVFQCRDSVLSLEIQQLKSDNGILKSKLANAEKQNSELIKLIETMSFPGVVDSSAFSPVTDQGKTWPNISTGNRFDALCDAPCSEVGSTNEAAAVAHRPPQRNSRSQPGSQSVPSCHPHSSPPLQSSLRQQSRPPPMRPGMRPPPPSPPLPQPRRCTTVCVVGSFIVRGVAPLVHGGEFCADGFVYPGLTAHRLMVALKTFPPLTSP